jgi:alkylhydroperoxidase family enzyme
MKLNALKHGCDAAPENDAAVMRALGEDPERFAALKRELATANGPGDALWDRQIDDLSRLYWRRDRIERMETGLMRDGLEQVEERRRGLARALADVTFEPSQCEAVALDLPKPPHPPVRVRMLI